MSDTLASTTTTVQTPETAREAGHLRPRHTVRSVDGAYEVGVVLPGVKRDTISVRLDDGVLAIEGRREEVEIPGAISLHREIPAAHFRLDLEVRVPVDGSRISARFEDGVLTLRLPLKEVATAREIPVE